MAMHDKRVDSVPEAGRDAIETRKAFLRLEARDVDRLKALAGFAENHVDDIVEGLYEHLLSFEEARRLFPDEATIDRVKASQREYFLSLTSGDYGDSYVQRRQAIGIAHHRIGLEPEWYLGGYCYYLTATLDRLRSSPRQTVDRLVDEFTSLLKLIFLDMGLAIDAYIATSEEALTRLAQALASVGDGVCVTDLDGTIQFVNRSLLRILGYDEDELVGVNVSLLYPGGADSPALKEIMEGVRTGGWWGEAELQAKDGSPVATLESAQPLRDWQGAVVGFVCTNTDIRDRKLAEEAMRESEQRYRTVVESVTDAISINVEGKRVFVNDSFVKLFGLRTRDDAIGIDMKDFIHPDDAAMTRERLAATERGEDVSAFIDLRIERPDGEVRTAQAAGTSIVYRGLPARLVVLRDVTAHRLAERDIRARSEELQAIFNIASVLSAPGTFSDQVTAVLEELIRLLDLESADLRIPQEEKEGLVVVASVGSARQPPGTFRAFDDSRTGRAFLTGEPIISHDFAANHRGGVGRGRRVRSGYVSQSVAWMPVKAGGKMVGVVAVDTSKPNHFTPERTRLLTAVVDGMGPFLEAAKLREAAQRDVHELETTLAQLQAAQGQLLQSEKLAAIGTLISGVAHEINNPLGNILGRVELMQEAAADDGSKRDLQTVRDETERAIRIVRNLLSFMREHKPETTLVSLNDTLDQVLELRAYELKVSNVELRKDFQADLPQILADPHQLGQVFLNLVINAEQAIAAAHGRGVLSVTTERVGDALHVVVADDGPGIPDEIISKIFDPFFTTKGVGAGTGLGLSVCYGIVKGHGGELRVESEEGKGTAFTVELPLRPQTDGGGVTADRPGEEHP